MQIPETSPWLDIPTRPLLTAGTREREALPNEGRPQTSDTRVRLLPREAAALATAHTRRTLRRRNNGLA